MDTRMVAVVTQVDDLTADLVIAELARRQVPVARFDTAGFPATLTLSAYVGGEETLHGTLTTPSRVVSLDGVRSLYYRRPSGYASYPHLPEQDAVFAQRQARYGLGGVLGALPGCLYVNHPHANMAADYKPAQLALAAQLGFCLPPTLITNDPQQAREFCRKLAPVIYKPLRCSPYQIDGEARTIWVTEVDAAELDESVAATAHLFQARVDKTCDLRVTVIGDQMFGVRINSGGMLDWRANYDALTYSVVELTDSLRAGIATFMSQLGLVFGCLDFAMRSDGEPVFLEINPNGQWSWLEEETGQPMTAALAGLLARGRP